MSVSDQAPNSQQRPGRSRSKLPVAAHQISKRRIRKDENSRTERGGLHLPSIVENPERLSVSPVVPNAVSPDIKLPPINSTATASRVNEEKSKILKRLNSKVSKVFETADASLDRVLPVSPVENPVVLPQIKGASSRPQSSHPRRKHKRDLPPITTKSERTPVPYVPLMSPTFDGATDCSNKAPRSHKRKTKSEGASTLHGPLKSPSNKVESKAHRLPPISTQSEDVSSLQHVCTVSPPAVTESKVYATRSDRETRQAKASDVFYQAKSYVDLKKERVQSESELAIEQDRKREQRVLQKREKRAKRDEKTRRRELEAEAEQRKRGRQKVEQVLKRTELEWGKRMDKFREDIEFKERTLTPEDSTYETLAEYENLLDLLETDPEKEEREQRIDLRISKFEKEMEWMEHTASLEITNYDEYYVIRNERERIERERFAESGFTIKQDKIMHEYENRKRERRQSKRYQTAIDQILSMDLPTI